MAMVFSWFPFLQLVNGQHAVGNEVMAIKIDLVFIWFSLFNLAANLKRGNQLALGKEDKKRFHLVSSFQLGQHALGNRVMKINVFAPPAFALSLIPQCNALQRFTFARAGISHFRERVHICQIQGNFIQSTKWAFPQSSIGSDRSMNRNSDFPAFYSPQFLIC